MTYIFLFGFFFELFVKGLSYVINIILISISLMNIDSDNNGND